MTKPHLISAVSHLIFQLALYLFMTMLLQVYKLCFPPTLRHTHKINKSNKMQHNSQIVKNYSLVCHKNKKNKKKRMSIHIKLLCVKLFDNFQYCREILYIHHYMCVCVYILTQKLSWNIYACIFVTSCINIFFSLRSVRIVCS